MKKLLAVFLLCELAFAGIGKFVLVKGNVEVTRDGKVLKATNGMDIEKKDNIKTIGVAKVQIKLEDNTIVTLGKNTDFSINDYVYAKNNSKIDMGVEKGNFKVISGEVGKVARNNFKFKANSAVIGIRGTIFAGDVGDKSKKDVIACVQGGITVHQNGIAREVNAGKMVEVTQTEISQPKTIDATKLDIIEALDSKSLNEDAKEDSKQEKKEAKKQAKQEKKEAKKQAKQEKKEAKKQAKQDAQKLKEEIKKVKIQTKQMSQKIKEEKIAQKKQLKENIESVGDTSSTEGSNDKAGNKTNNDNIKNDEGKTTEFKQRVTKFLAKGLDENTYKTNGSYKYGEQGSKVDNQAGTLKFNGTQAQFTITEDPANSSNNSVYNFREPTKVNENGPMDKFVYETQNESMQINVNKTDYQTGKIDFKADKSDSVNKMKKSYDGTIVK